MSGSGGHDGSADAATDTATDASSDATSSSDAASDAIADAASDARPDSDACVPLTCQQQGFNCGSASDGCGHLIDCGTCTGCTLRGSEKPNVCGPMPACVCVTCSQLGYNCGKTASGCGGILDCGTCTLPKTCGGGGVVDVCGVPP